MKAPGMNRPLALLLQIGVVLLGVVVLALLLWEPHLEGRNAHATTFEIYFHDPFLAYVYAGSIPFFVALVRAFELLADVRRTGAFSRVTLNALRGIKRCALTLMAFVAGAAVIIILTGDGEDRAGGIFMCLLATLGAGVMATAAALLGRSLQKRLNAM
jgi:hypothetical protein